jgi:putative oxidoreductase
MDATIADFATLLLRLWIGLNLALAHGVPKVADPQAFLATEGVQQFPLPTLAGWFAIAAELVGGICLVLGLRTRIAAAAVLVTMLAGALVVNRGEPWTGDKELQLTFAMLAFLFLVLGAGPLSVDARLERRRRRGPSPW